MVTDNDDVFFFFNFTCVNFLPRPQFVIYGFIGNVLLLSPGGG